VIFLVLYVDDILLASNDLGLLHETKQLLSQSFEMKDLGEASYVIGIEIHRDKQQKILRLSREAYIEKVLERFRMSDCKSSVVLIAKGERFSKGKIYISPPNYHHFSGWHPELPTLALRPPKLQLFDFLAPSVYLYR
jgi:hypothetical protein